MTTQTTAPAPTTPATDEVTVTEIATMDLPSVRKALAAAGWRVVRSTANRGSAGYSDIVIAPKTAGAREQMYVRCADVREGDRIQVGGRMRTVAAVHGPRGMITYRVQGTRAVHFLNLAGPDAIVTVWR